MFITRGHFLSPFVRAKKRGEVLTMLHSIDTDLMVAVRLVGFDPDDKTPIIDLVRVDDVYFNIAGMPSHLQDLIPDSFRIVEESDNEGNKDEEE